VLAQARIDVLDGDTPDAIAARLLPHEHRLLVACVDLIARRTVFPTPFGVAVDGQLLGEPLLLDDAGALRDAAGFLA
jgi:phosphoribosylglycinamide formyltransferase-1